MIENSKETLRTIESIVPGQETTDGAGVKLTRVFAQNLQRRLDPFLMFDAFSNENPDDYISGFPDHPHRGFETITYMINGQMRHNDSAGNSGILQSGGVQWMVAGSGLIHSEIPEQQSGLLEGFQLWLNLPAKEKMATPAYRDFPSTAIPELKLADDITVRIIAGSLFATLGAMQRERCDPQYYDILLSANNEITLPISVEYNCFIYVFRGTLTVADKNVNKQQMAILSNDGNFVKLTNSNTQTTRILLIAGKALNEPIARYGPFVMNTQEEIEMAFNDYRAGKFNANQVKLLNPSS